MSPSNPSSSGSEADPLPLALPVLETTEEGSLGLAKPLTMVNRPRQSSRRPGSKDITPIAAKKTKRVVTPKAKAISEEDAATDDFFEATEEEENTQEEENEEAEITLKNSPRLSSPTSQASIFKESQPSINESMMSISHSTPANVENDAAKRFITLSEAIQRKKDRNNQNLLERNKQMEKELIELDKHFVVSSWDASELAPKQTHSNEPMTSENEIAVKAPAESVNSIGNTSRGVGKKVITMKGNQFPKGCIDKTIFRAFRDQAISHYKTSCMTDEDAIRMVASHMIAPDIFLFKPIGGRFTSFNEAMKTFSAYINKRNNTSSDTITEMFHCYQDDKSVREHATNLAQLGEKHVEFLHPDFSEEEVSKFIVGKEHQTLLKNIFLATIRENLKKQIKMQGAETKPYHEVIALSEDCEDNVARETPRKEKIEINEIQNNSNGSSDPRGSMSCFKNYSFGKKCQPSCVYGHNGVNGFSNQERRQPFKSSSKSSGEHMRTVPPMDRKRSNANSTGDDKVCFKRLKSDINRISMDESSPTVVSLNESDQCCMNKLKLKSYHFKSATFSCPEDDQFMPKVSREYPNLFFIKPNTVIKCFKNTSTTFKTHVVPVGDANATFTVQSEGFNKRKGLSYHLEKIIEENVIVGVQITITNALDKDINLNCLDNLFTIVVDNKESVLISAIDSPVSLKPTTWFTINGSNHNIMFDSGAGRNCISYKFYQDSLKHVKLERSDIVLTGANNTALNVQGRILLRVSREKVSFQEYFYVVEQLSRPIIVGYPTMNKRSMLIDCANNSLLIRNKKLGEVSFPFVDANKVDARNKFDLFLTEDIALPPLSETLVHLRLSKADAVKYLPKSCWISTSMKQFHKSKVLAGRRIHDTDVALYTTSLANVSVDTISVSKNTCVASMYKIDSSQFEEQEIDLINEIDQVDINTISDNMNTTNIPVDIKISSELTVDQTSIVKSLIQEFSGAFATDNTAPSHVDEKFASHSIDTPGVKPISCAPRRVSPKQRVVISEHTKKMLAANIIRKSKSPWSSPVTLVHKSDGEFRFCIDYRRLNEATTKDVYPLPRIDDTLDALGGAKYMSTLDLASGYWQIPMAKDSVEKTAFVTHDGLFEYTRMPFGLTNAPATFQRHLDGVLAGLKWQCCLVYIDDIIIYSNTFEDHIRDLRFVLQRILLSGLKLKASKCHICCNKVNFLGHVISDQGIQPNVEKIIAIRDTHFSAGVPEHKKLESFVGLTGYYRKFIKDYSSLTVPLRVCFAKKEWEWTDECVTAFNSLKDLLTREGGPILALPRFNGEFRFSIHTDASDSGIGAVLYQQQDNEWRVIQYSSRSLTKTEIKWHTQEKEALAIIWACDKYRPYLIGTSFDVMTDHASLEFLKKSEKGRLARWALKIAEYNPIIMHKSGKSNVAPDHLSRFPNTIADELEPEMEIPTVELLSIEGEVYHAEDKSLSYSTTWDLSQLSDSIKQEYLFDSQTKDIISYLELDDNKKALTINHLKYKLYSFNKDRLIMRKLVISGECIKQILIPNGSQATVIKLFHDEQLAGHLGRDKTFHKMFPIVWWKGMYKHIRTYIQTCDLCQRFKSNVNRKNRLMYSSSPCRIWECAHIDLVGPFPESRTAMKYICVITDSFSKYVESIALQNKAEETVANAIFNKLICTHSIPNSIRTDQGNEFTNKLLTRLATRLGIRKIVGMPYYPQANGQVERMNKTIVDCLKAQCAAEPSNWDTYLSGVTFAYNTSIHAELRCSPFELMFGRTPVLPLELLKADPIQLLEDVDTYRTRLTYNMCLSHHLVSRLLKNIANTRDKHWNDKARPIVVNVGDEILLEKPLTLVAQNIDDRSTKLLSDYSGPYKVIKVQRNSLTIWNDDRIGDKKEHSISLSNAKLYKRRSVTEVPAENDQLNIDGAERMATNNKEHLNSLSNAKLYKGNSVTEIPAEKDQLNMDGAEELVTRTNYQDKILPLDNKNEMLSNSEVQLPINITINQPNKGKVTSTDTDTIPSRYNTTESFLLDTVRDNTGMY